MSEHESPATEADIAESAMLPNAVLPLTDPDSVVDRVRQGLLNALGSSEDFSDFKSMDEWELVNQGKISEFDLLNIYATAADLEVIDEEELDNIETFSEISFDYLSNWICIPISWDALSVALAIATPYRLGEIAAHWRHLMGRKVNFYLSQRTHIERVVTAVYDQSAAGGEDGNYEIDPNASEEALRDLALEAPIVRLVNDMFARAVEMNASDIHVEPSENELAIRFRVDGILQTAMTPPVASYPAIAGRLKLIGGLNIAERRLPQDGRTDLQIGRTQIDIRLSTIPCMHGESIVLRILRKNIETFNITNIGMQDAVREAFTELVQLPHGMVLVVGPTGSGKTTTLYCIMNLLDTERKKIITIEDPIEYQINGVTQIQVRPAIGLTFASGLRHIVRQDPDIILVGEIRDKETAEIAINAALTGHLVLSTLHTNDATGAISRLLDMGVENFLISSALVGVLSQRLVRRVCGDCKGSGTTTEARTGTVIRGVDAGNEQFRNCRTCGGSGYRERVGIYEFLPVNDEIRRAITQEVDNATLNRIARDSGMVNLREDGEEKVRNAITTAAEVARVCQLDF
ncbi:MAG: GspE/PulE family protein [Lentisphaeria bacterium]|jgi:type II secretory ATPase GspE/PulE/Tfp pilus assembly ATPase PilB-like protein|nr:GspE/PulE family protein [Lentisphaeria bacterium]